MLPNPMHLFLALSSFSTSFFPSFFLFSNASTRHVYQHQSTFSYSSVFPSESTLAESKHTTTLHTQELHQVAGEKLASVHKISFKVWAALTSSCEEQDPLHLGEFLWGRALLCDTPTERKRHSVVPGINFGDCPLVHFSSLPNQTRCVCWIVFIGCIQDA